MTSVPLLRQTRWLLRDIRSGRWMENLVGDTVVWTEDLAAAFQPLTTRTFVALTRNGFLHPAEAFELVPVEFVASPAAPAEWRPLEPFVFRLAADV